MNPEEFRRTGTVPVIEAFETESRWKKFAPIAAVALLVLLGGWWFFGRGHAEAPREKALALRESDLPQSTKFAAEQLKAAKDVDEARFWRQFLAENYVKQGKKEQARPHYKWLVTRFPKEEAYRKALKSLGPSPKNGKKRKKKPAR